VSDEQRIPETERLEAVARRAIADILAHGRRYAFNLNGHSCRGFDEKLRCNVCGRDGKCAPDVVTLFVGTLGHWWVNGTGGGRAVDYVPANLVLPVLRGYLAQRDELQKLRVEREKLEKDYNDPFAGGDDHDEQ
jgi:hypothetical protein